MKEFADQIINGLHEVGYDAFSALTKLKSAQFILENTCRACGGNGEFSPKLGHHIAESENCVKCKGTGGKTVTISLTVTKEPIKKLKK